MKEKIKILLIDDRKENLLALEHLLVPEGYKVDKACSGVDALRMSLKEDYALFLLDVQMPEMDGFEVAQQLNSINKTKDIPIIFNTATSHEISHIKKGFDSGAVDYITKPIDSELLKLKVKAMLLLYRQKEELKIAREKLKLLNNNLEQIVEERTLELQKKNRQLETSMGMGKMGFWEWNTVTNEIQWSREKYAILGLDPKAMRLNVNTAFSYIHEDDRGYILNLLNWHQLNKENLSCEYRAWHSSGSLMNIWLKASIVLNKKGNTVGISCISQDITERKKTEEKLRKNEQYYRTVVETISDGIIHTDSNLSIIFVNNIFCQILSIAKENALNSSLNDIFNAQLSSKNVAALKKLITRCKKQKKVQLELTLDNIHDNPSHKNILLNAVPLPGENNSFSGILATITNITEIKNAEKELLDLNKELVYQNKDLRQFNYIVSHNLRAPVSNILGLSGLYKTEKEPDPTNRYIVEQLQNAAQSLDGTIKDLNTTLSIRNSSNEIKVEIDLKKLLISVREMVTKEISHSKAVIRTDFKSVGKIYSIKSYLQNIFYNLLVNAIKYKANNRNPEIFIKTEDIGPYICFTFCDNGIGIDLEKHGDKLFMLYKRFHDHVEGKGMGLYLVKTQVEILGGKIDVNSKVGHGTTFWVYIKK